MKAEVKIDITLRVLGLVLLAMSAWVFHIASNFIHLAAEGRNSLFTSFWMTQVLMSAGAWAYLVPAFGTGLLWFRTLPGSGRSATPLVLFIYFVLGSALWLIGTLGIIEPLGSPEAVL